MATTTVPDAAAASQAAVDRPTSAAAKTSRWRRIRRVVVLAALLAVAVWQAPAIVCHTPLRHQILPLLLPDYAGRIETGAMTLGWFAPIELSDVTFYAPDEGRLLHVASVRSEKSLAALILDRPRAGHFYIVEPELTLRLRTDGSNLEDAAAGLLMGGDGTGGSVEFALDVTGGTVQVIDTEHDHALWLRDVKLALSMPLSPHEALRIAATGGIESSDPTRGQGRLRIDVEGPALSADGEEATAGRAVVEVENAPLQPLSPLLARLCPDAELESALSCSMTAQWQPREEGPTGSAEATIALRDLALSAPAWLGDDRFRADEVRYDGRFVLDGETLRAEASRVVSDFGECELSCTARVDEVERLASAGDWKALAGSDFRTRGRLDLARLAAVLPRTLHLRDDIRLTAGTARWAVSHAAEETGRQWEAELEASGIEAVREGRTIRWELPLLVSLTARRSEAGLVVERFACRSDLLQLVGQATTDAALISAEGDLEQTARQLGEILDLDGWQIAGHCVADLRVRRREGNQVSADGSLRVTDLRVAQGGGPGWSARQLLVEVDALGTLDGQSLTRIDSGTLRVSADTDRCELILQEPVFLDATDVAAAVQVELQGDLASWQSRLSPWLPAADWRMGGAARMTGNLVLSSDRLVLQDGKLEAQRLRVDGPALHLNEAWVRIETGVTVDLTAGTLSADRTTWASPSLSLRADAVSANWTEGNTVGTVVFRGGVRELSEWFRDPRAERMVALSGTLSGQARLQRTGEGTEADWRLAIADFAAADLSAAAAGSPAGAETWTERELLTSGRAVYSSSGDAIEIPRIQVRSDALRFDAQGRIDDVSRQCLADLTGEIDADLAKLIVPLRGVLGDGMQFTGHNPRPFALRGALRGDAGWAADLTAQAGVGWTTANIYGFPLGAATWDANLREGTLHFSRLDLPVSEGRIVLQPRILLSAETPALVMDEGAVVETVRLTPEMCRQWLKYVAPLMADATQIDGRLSASVSQVQVPLAVPTAGEVAGKLDIHGAELRPGPRLDSLLQVARQVQALIDRRPAGQPGAASAWVTLPEQSIDVAMSGGRVRHATFQMQIGDLTIRTSGSVGFDETLDLVAEIPIRDEWIAREPRLAGLKGSAVRIPIRGTVSQPQIDPRVLTELARQLAGNAAGRFLEDKIGKGLDRLFGRERP